MMNETDLQDAINAEAEEKFHREWNFSPANQKARLAYQKLKQTTEWRDFRNATIEENKKEIVHNILANMQGLKDLVKRAGEE